MMLRLDFAAVSDVGRVRKDNQDSGYAGPHLLVIADGVGGAARGDIASHAAVEQLRKLDRPPGNGMLEELAGTIHRTHDRIAELVEQHPEIDGTSTTLTAALFDGSQLALGHVGDSRAYLLRGGELRQLTTDHTFVQSLVDEGRITSDEARIHPHRNLILRAVDGVHEPEPDLDTVPVEAGDRLLLCSDGCTGSLADAEVGALLGSGSPHEAATTLVSAALDAGSTDNVTVLVADVTEPPEGAAAAPTPLLVGAGSAAPRFPVPSAAAPVDTRTDTGELDPVDDGPPDPEDPEAIRYAPRPPRRFIWLRRVVALLVVVILVAVIGAAGYRWTQTQYYVGNDGQAVVIYRGVEADVPGLTMHRVHQRSALTLDQLTAVNQRQVRDGIGADSLAGARKILTRLEDNAPCGQTSATPSPNPNPSKRPSKRPSTSSTPAKKATGTAKASTRPRHSSRTPSRAPTPAPTASPTGDCP